MAANVVCFNVLLSAYAKAGDTVGAERVMARMEEEKGGVDINWDSGVDRCVLPLHQLTLQYTWMFEHY